MSKAPETILGESELSRVADVARRLRAAPALRFSEKIRLAGLSPERDLRYGNWSGITFDNDDLTGFDLTGANLTGSTFKEAVVRGACFDQARLDPGALAKASDFAIAEASWAGDLAKLSRKQLRRAVKALLRENDQLRGSRRGSGGPEDATSRGDPVVPEARFIPLPQARFESHNLPSADRAEAGGEPVDEQLAALASAVEALEKARLRDQATMSEQVRQFVETVGSTKETTQGLLKALRASPGVRGRWGENSLRNVLERSGLSAHIDFKEQFLATDGEGTQLRPDVVINLPGGRCIVVDSKVALSGYLDAIEATDDAIRELHLKKHVAELQSHVKNLASKEYQRHVPETAEFVLLFVPDENFLATAAERDPNLFDEAFSQKVILTTPTTMVALARVVAHGWRQEGSAQNTREIADLGRDMHTRMAIMADKMAKVGDSIEKTVKSYNELVGSVESRILPQARKFRELGVGDAGIDVASPVQVESAPRQVAPPEQLDLMPPASLSRKRSE